jgi:hypothetical protein
MRAGTAAGRTLALARKTALVLFACSVLLPVVTVFRRDAAGGGASSDAGALLDEAAFRASDGSAHAGVRQAAARKLPSDAPPDAPAGMRVLVFLARESGSVLQLHVRPGGDVCSGASGEGETLQRAALRVLWDCAALGPPPDIEFLERVGVGVAAEPVAYVALVRSERLLLRGSASAQLQVRAPAAAACAVLLRAMTAPRRLTASRALALRAAPCVSRACPLKRCRPSRKPLPARWRTRPAWRARCRLCRPFWRRGAPQLAKRTARARPLQPLVFAGDTEESRCCLWVQCACFDACCTA